MPAGLADADAGIGLNEQAIGSHGHRADDNPVAEIVIEAPEGRDRAGRQAFASDRVGQIREANRDRAIEIFRAAGLNGDHQRKTEPGWQGTRETVRRDRRDADTAAAGAVCAEERIGRYGNLKPGKSRIVRHYGRRESDRGVIRHADRAQRALDNQGQVNQSGAAGEVIGFARSRAPLFADHGIVGQVRVADARGHVRERAAIDMHKEIASGRRLQAKEAVCVRHGAQRLFHAVDCDRNAL